VNPVELANRDGTRPKVGRNLVDSPIGRQCASDREVPAVRRSQRSPKIGMTKGKKI
jgi:hypothetical protein